MNCGRSRPATSSVRRGRARRDCLCTRFDAHGDGPDSREELFAHFTQEQIVEITLVAAMANFTNRFNNGLQMLPGA